MELGTRLKEARLEQGLSQRQLCGEEITRNMLSQIENGSARPSMDTLRYLAARLGKPVSFFLEEETVSSPNQDVMARAREAHRLGDGHLVLAMLEDYRGHDPLFDEEAGLLRLTALLDEAEKALGEGKRPYALSLLDQAEAVQTIYRAALERRRMFLLARAKGDPSLLPDLDEELMLLAETAEPEYAAALLNAVRDRESPRCCILRGQIHIRRGEYTQAAQCLHLAEEANPKETAPLLETCYREMEDYKMAYFYACKQR